METYKTIKPEDISGNLIKMIGTDWMLVTAGDQDSFNTMTASWGFAGVMWNRPAAICFIRPERHTFGFIEKADSYTLSFFDEKYRDALKFCGSKSGRDCNKPKETGLTPLFLEDGTVTFKEASLILSCRKLYADDIKPGCFIDTDIIDAQYKTAGYHRMFVGEIQKVLKHC